MFEDDLPAYARGKTAKVAAGLGAIARVVGDGEEIYRRKLTFAEAAARVRAVHEPYHAALADLVSKARRRHGAALLIDWHSMPSAAVGSGCDIVLGDRFGVACSPAAPRLVERTLRAMGYAVARNAPYAGGYTTAHYGRPSRAVHALQIEINRSLYMDEGTLTPSSRFTRLQADLEVLFAALAAVDWATV
jgi:N-formylglutamate amidohydrolase